MARYQIFHRTWWKENSEWPNGLEPEIGESHNIGKVDTKEEAREKCANWTCKKVYGKKAGKRQERLGDKAEFREMQGSNNE